ncbi:MAG TPA: hypothetical protein VMT91_13765 [Anaerolineales bacterium]|nr:hypothetical protein [Anaerolineales bacterium]
MSKRLFLIVWIIFLLILGGLAAWFTFGPALRNKAQAFTNYQKTLGLPGQLKNGKIPVQVGISIEKISDFSIKNVAWNTDFYVWFRWQPPADDPAFNPGNSFQMVAGSITNKQKLIDLSDANGHYELYRLSASVNYPFDVARYPVDDHLLRLFIQDPVHPLVQYVADRKNSRIDPTVHIPGYQIASSAIGAETIATQSTFGNPAAPQEVAQFGYGIFIVRQGFGFYLKLFQALFAAVGVALLAGFFKAHEEIRIELLVGGFFAAVANSYITSTYLPDTGVMTLMDFVNLLGLVTIFLCMIQTVISSRIAAADKEFSRRFDQVSFGMIAVIYLGLNIALPLVARLH